MTSSHARKPGRKYRYYLSSALLQGQPERCGSVRRVPSADVEALVIRSVQEHLKPSSSINDRGLVNTHVTRVEVQAKQLVMQLAAPQMPNRRRTDGNRAVRVPRQKTPSTHRREILLPASGALQHARPIRSETRATLVALIARGRRWLAELVADPTASAESIAQRRGAACGKST